MSYSLSDYLFSFIFWLTIGIFLYLSLSKRRREYEKSEYFKMTNCPWKEVKYDKGKFGEYIVSKHFSNLNGYSKFLFNVYVPTAKGTTEIDILLLHESGIFVIESKNFNGWIFGNEKNRKWTVTLPAKGGRSQKFYFYNPIHQNRGHIEALSTYLDLAKDKLHSFIVFSNNCSLKQLTVSDSSIFVIHTDQIENKAQTHINSLGISFNKLEIDRLYEKLLPLTKLSEAEKQNHISNIKKGNHII